MLASLVHYPSHSFDIDYQTHLHPHSCVVEPRLTQLQVESGKKAKQIPWIHFQSTDKIPLRFLVGTYKAEFMKNMYSSKYKTPGPLSHKSHDGSDK